MKASKTRIKAILVGAGRMGKNHLRVLRESADFQLQGVLERDPHTLHSVDVGNIPVFSDPEQLTALDYQAVVVVTPTPTHYEVTKHFLNEGKAVLVEKPITSNYAQGRELIEMAQAKGIPLAVAHVERFNPVVRKLREVLNEGWLGTPIHFSFTRVGGYPEKTMPGNNVLLDLAVHDIDILRNLVGPVRVETSMCHSTVQQSVLDTAEIFFSSLQGPSASVHVNWITPTKIRTIRVTGTRGVCFVDYILQSCSLLGGRLLKTTPAQSAGFERLQEIYKSTDRIEFGVTKEEPLKAQLAQFARLLRDGEAGDLCSGADALGAVLLADRAIDLDRKRHQSVHPPAAERPFPQPDADWV